MSAILERPTPSLPLWTPEAQANFYEALGYGKHGQRADGTPWTRPDETDRFLYNWDQRFHVVICPARASKSYSAAKKAMPVIMGRRETPDGRVLPTRGWIVGPTYELAAKEFEYLYHDLVIEGPRRFGWPGPRECHFSVKAGDMRITTAWGSQVIAKSADKPQSLLGEELDWVLLSEAAQFPGEIWTRYLEPRLSTTRGYAFFPTTPAQGALWLYKLYNIGLAGTSDEWAGYSWDVSGNPIYPMSELDEKRKFYGEDSPLFQEQYLGRWTFYGGTVYGHDFSPQRNLIDPFEIPHEWRRIRGLDFGYRDPFVCLWFAVAESSERLKTRGGDLILYREYYRPGRSMAEHAEVIKRLTGDERVLYTVADSSEQQSIADLRRLGVPALDANRDRRAGRMLVGDAFRSGRLKFMRGRCPETMQELQFFRWADEKDKEGSKETTVGDDHAMDVIRYVMMSRPQARPTLARAVPGTFEHELRIRARERVMGSWPTLAGVR